MDIVNDVSEFTLSQKRAVLYFESGLFTSVESPAAIWAIINYGKELSLTEMYSLQNITIIEGKFSVSAQAMLALGMMKGVTYEILEESVKGCKVEFKRGDRKYVASFDEEDARRAGLLDVHLKGDKKGLMRRPVWGNYPLEMYRWRAVTKGLRVIAPDCVAGMYPPEELRSIAREKPQALPEQTKKALPETAKKPAPKCQVRHQGDASKDQFDNIVSALSSLGLWGHSSPIKSYFADYSFMLKKEDEFEDMTEGSVNNFLTNFNKNILTFFSEPCYHKELIDYFTASNASVQDKLLNAVEGLVEKVIKVPELIDAEEARAYFALYLDALLSETQGDQQTKPEDKNESEETTPDNQQSGDTGPKDEKKGVTVEDVKDAFGVEGLEPSMVSKKNDSNTSDEDFF